MVTTAVSSAIESKFFTIAEYLEREDAAAVRHEFHNGTLQPMAGGILPHNVIKGEIFTFLNIATKKARLPHMALNSDTKVRIEAFNRFVYPDVTLSDETPEYYTTPDGATRRDIIINPLAVIEVLSDDTRNFDKNDKFDMYASIPGFREYILIEPEQVWAKSQFWENPAENLWRIEILTDRTATLTIHSLNLQLSLEELYSALDRLQQ